jgi:phosphonate transport system permease protein
MRLECVQPEEAIGRRGVGIGVLLVALAMLPFSDLAVSTREPWTHLLRFLSGFLAPNLGGIGSIAWAVAYTVAFGLGGVFIGAVSGLLLAPIHHWRTVHGAAATLRAVHELFWALLFLQVFGPSAITGVLAIALPYAGVFTKVYAEMLEEADRRPDEVLPPCTSAVSRFIYARLPMALAPFRIYTLYRVECGMRSSAVLGFVGLPTLGFELDAFFKSSQYQAVAGILIVYYLLIASIRLWLRPALAPVFVVAAFALLFTVQGPPFHAENLVRFLTEDIVPAPLREGGLLLASTWSDFARWLWMLLSTQALPGLWNTVIVTQMALAVTMIVALAGFPLIVPHLSGWAGSLGGHVVLVIGRSTPEYMLVYIVLQMLGPSMLPAVIALGVHNGAIIAHLIGRQADAMTATLRADAPRGLNLYSYEYVPRLYGSFLAYAFYRWEIILRESAIVGILGVRTLGYYVDGAITEIRIDRALALIAVTVLATFAVDAIARALRRRFRLSMNDVGARDRAECY